MHIPSLDAVISGEVVYNGIHLWLAFTDHDKRMQWIASVEHIEALNPGIVVAGHKPPAARDDEPAAILGATKTYIRDFERPLSGSHSAQELVDKMMVLHGDRGNPYNAVDSSSGRLRARTGSIFMTKRAHASPR